MEESFKADINRIKEASITGKLVVFVGAGVSVNSGLPSWNRLIDQLKNELPKDVANSENDYLKIAQLYKNHREFKEYIEKIRHELNAGNTKINPIHEVIFELSPIHVVTTNYDDLLEKAVLQKNLQYYKICKDVDIPYATYDRYIIKMHGDLEEGNIVFTEDDYLNYEKNFPLIETFVKSLFAANLVLFIGFSFDDYNLKFITNKVRNILGQDFQLMYLLNIGRTDFIRRDYYKKRGVQIIDYLDDNEQDINKSISEKDKGRIDSISHDKGKKLYKLIRYIANFDRARHEFEGDNVIKFFYRAIDDYFNELSVVGAKELLKYYPFNSSDRSSFSRFTLHTDYTPIFDLADILKNDFSAKRKFLKNYATEYRAVLDFARRNGIYHIRHTENQERFISLPLPKLKQEKPGLDLFYEFNFEGLLRRIQLLKAKVSSEVSMDDLELPFLLYKTGSFYESYIRFRDLAQRCWINQKYILYYICQSNLRQLGQLVMNEGFKNKNLNIQIARDIWEESVSIDLDSILNSIRTSNDNIHQILASVKDYRFIYKNAYLNNKSAEEIRNSSRIAKNNGFSSNSFADDLTERTLWLWSFTNENYLVSEHWNDHQFVYRKAFEGFIISNNIPESKNGFFPSTSKLLELDIFHVIIVLFGSNNKVIEQLFVEHEIDHIKLNAQGIDFLFRAAFNALDSFNVSKSIGDGQYYSILEGAFKNLLLIVTRLDNEDEFVNRLLRALADNTQINLSTYENVIALLVQRNQIDSDLLLSLLDSAILRIDLTKGGFKLINEIISKLEIEEGQILIRSKEARNLLTSRKLVLDYRASELICYLYRFLPKVSQRKISNIIFQSLSKTMKPDLFSVAYSYGLIEEELFVNQFIEYMETYAEGKSKRSDGDFHMRILGQIYLNSNEKVKNRIADIAENSDYLKFLIFPDSIERDDTFDISWLYNLNPSQYNRLNSISGYKDMIKSRLRLARREDKLWAIYLNYFS